MMGTLASIAIVAGSFVRLEQGLLQAGKNHRVRLPADTPAKQFRSLTMHDPAKRFKMPDPERLR